MTIPGDGRAARPEARRWRVDDRRAEEEMAVNLRLDGRATGRRVVIAIVVVVLAAWLGLDLTFRAWKARYRALARFGETRVAPVIDPIASTVPPDVDSTEWRVAVSETHAMLLALVGTGVLDETQMDDLRREIAAKVAAARPETARQTLADLWDDLERKAGPLIAADRVPPPANSRQAARHPRPPRPKILGPSNASRDRRSARTALRSAIKARTSGMRKPARPRCHRRPRPRGFRPGSSPRDGPAFGPLRINRRRRR